MENYTIEVSNVGKTYKLYKKHTDRLKETLNPFNLKYHKELSKLCDEGNLDKIRNLIVNGR